MRERTTRRRRRIGPSPARAGAILGLLAGILALYGLTTSSAFAIQRIDVSPLAWTDQDLVVRTLGVEPGRNAFGLATADLASRLLALPAVVGARVDVALPDELRVAVTERVPVLAWRVGSLTFVVDRTGQVFAPAPKTGARDASGARLPLIVDARAASPGTVAVGRQLDPIDLDAATRLASLTPGDVGSSVTTLTVRVTDDDGWILTTSPPSWTAVFGPYTPVLRTPDLIPAQVRLLRSLIAGREGRYARVVLADGEHGTYLPQPSGGG